MSVKESYDKFTVLIPSYNRPEHLRRILSYYESFGVRVIVADGSDEVFPYTSDFGKRIEYRHFPSCEDPNKRFYEAANSIFTPYVCFCADDDFAVPDTINKIVDYLEKNPDYNCGLGIINYYSFKNEDIYHFRPYYYSIGKNLSEALPRARVMHYMTNYFQNVWNVQRTDTFKKIFASLFTHKDMTMRNGSLNEIYIALYLAIEGKCIILPLLYSAREIAPPYVKRIAVGMESIISKIKYRQKYNKFLNLLSMHLSKTENISMYEARCIIIEAVRRYIFVEKPASVSFKYKIKHTIELFKHKLKIVLEKNGPSRLVLLYRSIFGIIGINRSNVEDVYPLSLQDIEHWDKIKAYILKYKHIYDK